MLAYCWPNRVNFIPLSDLPCTVCANVSVESYEMWSHSHCVYMYADCVAYFVDTVTTYNT